MRSLNEWILTYEGKSMLSLKTASETKLIPFKIDRPYIATIYDPYNRIQLDYTSRKLLNKYDSRVPVIEKGQTAALFSEPYSATMVRNCGNVRLMRCSLFSSPKTWICSH